jgi:hypothetical protein
LDFSYKAVVALGKDRGMSMPSEKSIVNPTGAHYRELIHSWRIMAHPKPKSKNDSNSWIESIDDPVLRLSVNLLAKELRALKAKIARQEKTTGAPIYLGGSVGQLSPISQESSLIDVEILALKAAIDPKVLSLVGLSIGARGEVIDVKGRVIHKPGFRDAIEKIISLRVG